MHASHCSSPSIEQDLEKWAVEGGRKRRKEDELVGVIDDRTYESRPGDRVRDSCGAPQEFPVDTMVVVVIIRVIVVIDGDEAGMPRIGPLGPAQPLFH